MVVGYMIQDTGQNIVSQEKKDYFLLQRHKIENNPSLQNFPKEYEIMAVRKTAV